jgi:hypothetical protein
VIRVNSNVSKWISASALFVAAVAVTASCAVSGNESESVSPSKPTNSPSAPADSAKAAKESAIEEEYDGLTVSEQNASDSALDYLDYFLEGSGTSKSGLVEQLEHEGFSNADATTAVNFVESNVDGDIWGTMAMVSARSYMEMSSFSESGLTDQLLFEGYTAAQAAKGVAAAY